MMKTDDYNDQSITKGKIRDGNITSEKLADGAVSTDKLPDGAIKTPKIADGAVSTSKIAPRSVTNEKIAHDSVSMAELTSDVRSSINKKADAKQVNNSLYDLEKKIGDRFVVEGDVTNLPDEEDLTSSKGSERDVLKLADRSYAPYDFSGKGYKILRKNIKQVTLAVTKIVVSSVPTSDGYLAFIINGVESHVDVIASTDTTTNKVADKIATKLSDTMTEYKVSKDASTITLTRKFDVEISQSSSFSAVNTGVSCSITDSTKKELRNLLTPIMMNQPNTIYEIRYDFDLDGETIEMQEGCTLKFEGGEFTNGAIISNNTNVEGSPKITKLYGFLHNEKSIRYNSNQKLARTDFDVIDPIIPYGKSSIDICCNNALKSGVEKMQIIYYLEYNHQVKLADNTAFWKYYSIKDCVNIIKVNGLKIYSLKFHKNQGFSNDASDEEMNNYVEYVKDIVLKYLEYTKDLKVVYISNEEGARTSEGNNWNNYHLKLINWLHEKGLRVGISCNNIPSTFSKISEELLNKIDIVGVNFYPYISFCGFMCKKSDIPTYINNVNIYCKNTLSYIYNRKANAKIVFSECGCMPYEYGLRKPYEYIISELGKKDDSGIIQYIYHAVCLPVSINNNVLEYYRWFQDGIEFDKQEIHNLFNSFIFK